MSFVLFIYIYERQPGNVFEITTPLLSNEKSSLWQKELGEDFISAFLDNNIHKGMNVADLASADIITVAHLNDEYIFYGFSSKDYRKQAAKDKLYVKKQVLDISSKNICVSEDDGLMIETLLLNYLSKYPFDSEMWMRLAKLEISMLWQDFDRIKTYLENGLLYDPKNCLLNLFLVYAEFHCFGFLKDESFNLLNTISSDDNEILSFKEFLRSLYYYHQCFTQKVFCKQYENCLINSILFYDKNVLSYKALGEFYLESGDKKHAKEHFIKAVKNIQKVYIFEGNYLQQDVNFDITQPSDFFDYYLRGIEMTKASYQDFLKLISNL